MELPEQIEAVLFYRAAPVPVRTLAKLFDVEEAQLTEACLVLQSRLRVGGTRLIITDSEVELATAPEADALIQSLRRDEMKRDIGKAGAETLAIILYRGPISRSEIDRIRGVNSSFIIRNLLVRGLIARQEQGRQGTFTVTPELLAHLGIESARHLPDFAAVRDTIEAFEAREQAAAKEES